MFVLSLRKKKKNLLLFCRSYTFSDTRQYYWVTKLASIS